MIPSYLHGPRRERRARRLEVTGEALLRLMRMLDGERVFRVDGLPTDAHIVAMNMDAAKPDTIAMYIESASFDVVEDGCTPERMELDWKEIVRPWSPTKGVS